MSYSLQYTAHAFKAAQKPFQRIRKEDTFMCTQQEIGKNTETLKVNEQLQWNDKY